MDPKIIEEIKRRNKLKMQQWEDRLKIGKIGKSDAAQPADTGKSPSDDAFNMLSDGTEAAPAAAPQTAAPVERPVETPSRPAPTPAPAAAGSADPAMARFDIGPADASRLSEPAPAPAAQAAAAPQPQTAPAANPAAAKLPPNVKQLHIDIIDGKIKLSRRNMSLEQAISTLAKVYNNYKKKLNKK